MADQTEKVTEGWHLDKRVNIAIILALVGQIFVFGGVWAVTQYRLSAAEGRLTALEASDIAARANDRIVGERLARIEQALVNVDKTLTRVDQALERISNRPTPIQPERR